MSEIQIDRSSIESLARKLSAPDSHLSDDERALAATILAAAADAADRLGTDRSAPGVALRTSALVAGLAALLLAVPAAAHSLPGSVQDQFSVAFTPGAIDRQPEAQDIRLPE